MLLRARLLTTASRLSAAPTRAAPVLAHLASPIRPLAALASRRVLSTSVEPAASPPPLPSWGSASPSSSVAYLSSMTPDIGPLALNRIRDNVGARRKKVRVGRGHGGGRGRTCGRGHKGHGQRAGNHGLLKKNGGSMKLQKGLPKIFGYRKPPREYQYINLWRVEEAVKSGRLPVPSDRPLNVKDLFDARLVTLRTRHQGVKLMGRGGDALTTKLNLEVQLASPNAIEAVERAGGSIESVYYNRVTLRAKLKPHRFEAAAVGSRHGNMRPRPALPPPKLMRDVYLTERHRGYLRDVEVGEVVRPHEHPEHVDMSARQKPKYPGWAAADQAAMAEGRPFIRADGSVAGAAERAAAQQRRPAAWMVNKENPQRRRDRAYVPPIPRKRADE